MNWIGGDSVLTVSNAPADSTAPTVIIDSPPAATPIHGTPTIAYTVSFDEYIDETTLGASNFSSAGTAPYSLGNVTNTSSYPYPSVVTVEVIPLGSGTVQLQITGTIKDLAGNALALPVNDDIVYTLDSAKSPRQEITVDGTNSAFSTGDPVSLTFDASGSDKLVVVITGEHGFPNNAGGNCSRITYDGVALTRAVDRNPITNPDFTVDQTYNDIWYLDDPGSVHTVGSIEASVSTRGSMTAFALSNTATGVSTTVISPQDSKSVSLITATDSSIVIASHDMGGYGNTADVQSVDTLSPLIETSALRTSTRGWCGHVTGYMMVASPSLVTPTFTGGNISGAHTIAAEFPGALIPPPSGIVIIVR